ncbi:MAG: SHOCT domain-containing protein [Smithellaceae bacterium]
MGYVIWLIVIGTSIWVLFDAKSIGVKKGQIKGIANMGPWGWFFVCLLLWIIGFPVYLAKRGEFKRINSSQSPIMSGDSLSQLEKLAEMKDKGILTEDEFNRQKQALLK